MSPPRSSSTETCREKWATLFLEAGAGGGVAVGLAGKLCRGLSSGVVPLRYSSGLSCCKGVPAEMTSMSSLERCRFGRWYSSPGSGARWGAQRGVTWMFCVEAQSHLRMAGNQDRAMVAGSQGPRCPPAGYGAKEVGGRCSQSP